MYLKSQSQCGYVGEWINTNVCYTLCANICFAFQMVNVQMDIYCVSMARVQEYRALCVCCGTHEINDKFQCGRALYILSENAFLLLWACFNGGDQSNSMEFYCKRGFSFKFFFLSFYSTTTITEMCDQWRNISFEFKVIRKNWKGRREEARQV